MILRSFLSIVVGISFLGSAVYATEAVMEDIKKLPHYKSTVDALRGFRYLSLQSPLLLETIRKMPDRSAEAIDSSAAGKSLSLLDIVLVRRENSNSYAFGCALGSFEGSKIWVIFSNSDIVTVKDFSQEDLYIPRPVTPPVAQKTPFIDKFVIKNVGDIFTNDEVITLWRELDDQEILVKLPNKKEGDFASSSYLNAMLANQSRIAVVFRTEEVEHVNILEVLPGTSLRVLGIDPRERHSLLYLEGVENLPHFYNEAEIAAVRANFNVKSTAFTKIKESTVHSIDLNIDESAKGKKLSFFDIVLMPCAVSGSYSLGCVFGSMGGERCVAFWHGKELTTKNILQKRLYIPGDATQSSYR